MQKRHSDYELHSVCFDPWAEKIRRYWKFLGGGHCHVFLGKSKGYVLFIKRPHPETGEWINIILVEEPLKLPRYRSLIWHEIGHVFGESSDDPVEHEFNADRWAIDRALKRGFFKVAEEIILRCSGYCSNKSVNSTYRESSKKILCHFSDLCRTIVAKYKTNG